MKRSEKNTKQNKNILCYFVKPRVPRREFENLGKPQNNVKLSKILVSHWSKYESQFILFMNKSSRAFRVHLNLAAGSLRFSLLWLLCLPWQVNSITSWLWS